MVIAQISCSSLITPEVTSPEVTSLLVLLVIVENKSSKTTNIYFFNLKKFTYLLAHHYTGHTTPIYFRSS